MNAVTPNQRAASVALSDVWVYDIETYPNFFSAGFENLETNERFIFEISVRRNDFEWLKVFLEHHEITKQLHLGYNNLHFDYVTLHEFMTLMMHRDVTYTDLYQKAQAIIDSPRNDWTHTVWESDHHIRQIDVFKIMHFDNHARSTSLKKLEVAMRAASVEDLPVEPGTDVPLDMMEPMLTYMAWDISRTKEFALKIWDRIEFRWQLDAKYGGRTRINYNDTRIGKEFFLDQLRQKGIQLKNGKQPIQTPRTNGIHVCERLLPIQFETPELMRIYDFFRLSVIPAKETKGFFTNLHAYLRDFKLDFGSGGIHASRHKQTFVSDNEYVILDCDVVSYYPSLAIQYGWYPEHLGSDFTNIYSDLFQQRISHKKGTPENAMLKLALNGTYGESNNKFSSFYDPAFTMAITVNGQLLLAKLMEMLLMNPNIEPIQMNTDGLTIRMHRSQREWYDQVCQMWSEWSRMDLEYVEYAKMAIRDVNNYVSIDVDGKVKRKNAYMTEPDWHQDHSALVVPKAIDAYLTDDIGLEHFIYTHTDPWDFMLSVKVPRSGNLLWGGDQIQNVTRYYMSLNGKQLVKKLDKGKPDHERRLISINEGWPVGLCNRADTFDWTQLNRRWYLTEAEKLLKGLGL